MVNIVGILWTILLIYILHAILRRYPNREKIMRFTYPKEMKKWKFLVIGIDILAFVLFLSAIFKIIEGLYIIGLIILLVLNVIVAIIVLIALLIKS